MAADAQGVDGVLTLSDGREVGYRQYGDTEARPLAYCHGFPTCRTELEILEPSLAADDVDARVIAFDRPGYGNSTAQPRRGFLDWPKDVAEAMDRLGVGEFSVLGVSGGAPFALGCASRLGPRVRRLGIAVGVGPPGSTGIDESLIFRTAPRHHLLARLQFALFAKGLERGQGERVFAQTLENLGLVDRPVLEQSAAKDWFLRTMAETFKQGGTAAALESGLYTDEWGFSLADIETEALLWYGGRDETVPASVGGWLADHLPHSRLEIWPDHGHFTWMLDQQTVAGIFEALAA